MMKKITFVLILLITSFGFAQNTSTGVVPLGTSDFTVKFDVNGTTNKVTMTMVGPSSVWLAVALNKTYSMGDGMGSGGEDVIIYHEVNNVGQIADRYLTGNGMPTSDGNDNQDWSITTNDIVGSVRTIVATRDLNTNDTNDYVFTTSANTALPLLWAKGNVSNTNGGLFLAYHGSKGGAASTLGTTEISVIPEFVVYPNPADLELNVEFPASIQKASVSVYSVLGTLVFQSEMDQWNSKINTSEWSSGVFIMNISSGDFSQTKRIIKH